MIERVRAFLIGVGAPGPPALERYAESTASSHLRAGALFDCFARLGGTEMLRVFKKLADITRGWLRSTPDAPQPPPHEGTCTTDTLVPGEKQSGTAKSLHNGLARDLNHESWLNATYQTILHLRRGAFIDVGANLGQTLLKILSMDGTRQYIGFEPHVACCVFIERFLLENCSPGCHIIPVALANRHGLARLLLRGDAGARVTCSTASLTDGFRPDTFYSAYKYVCTARGDDLIPALNLESIAAIKIDVEGAELEVVEGLLSTIDRYMPYVVFEVLNHSLAVTQEELDEETIAFRNGRIGALEALLRGRGYVIFQVLPEMTLRKLRRIAPTREKRISNTDYVAVSGNEERAFASAFSGVILDWE